MSKVVRISQGNYIVQVATGGSIVLDTGTTGAVRVTGNLIVDGEATQINTTNITITDNIIVLNQGDPGNLSSPYGVSQVTAGFEINRGFYPDSVPGIGGDAIPSAQIIWNEGQAHYDPLLSADVQGTFVARLKNSNYTGLQLSTLVAGNTDLTVDMRNQAYVITLANASGYESLVTSANDIPNRKFVTDYVGATGGSADVSNIHYPLSGVENSRVEASTSLVRFLIDGNLRAMVTSLGYDIDNVRISGDTISDTSTGNLIITSTSGSVDLNAVVRLAVKATPLAEANYTKVYAAAEGVGRSGVWFVNDTSYGSSASHSDELISRNRAVLLSILL